MATDIHQDVHQTAVEFLLRYRAMLDGPNGHPTNFSDGLRAIESQETTLRPLLKDWIVVALSDPDIPPSNLLDLLDGLLVFSWYQHWTRPQTDVVERLLELTRRIEDPKREALASYCHASMLVQLDRYVDALPLLREASLALFNNGLPAEGLRAGFFIFLPVAALLGADPNDVHMFSTLDRIDRLDSPVLISPGGRALLRVTRAGLNLVSGGNVDEALRGFEEATNDNGLRGWDAELAHCANGLAQAYGRVGLPAKALHWIDEAISVQEQLRVRKDLTSSYLVKGRILKAMGEWGNNVMDLFQTAMEAAIDHGGPLAMARAQEELGELWYARKDWTEARLAYMGSFRTSQRVDCPAARAIASRSSHNLREIRRRQRDPLAREDLWRPGWRW